MPSNSKFLVSGGADCFFFGFAPSCRLKKGWEFDAVFRTGRQQRGELVRLYYLRAPQARSEPAKVGVAVGKRIANAVGRARGRRVLRESFRRLLPWMKEDVWVVASLREIALRADAQTVYLDLARAARKACLLKETWPGADWAADSRCSLVSPQP